MQPKLKPALTQRTNKQPQQIHQEFSNQHKHPTTKKMQKLRKRAARTKKPQKFTDPRKEKRKNLAKLKREVPKVNF